MEQVQVQAATRSGIASGLDNLLRWNKLQLALNQARHAAHIGNYWYWVEVPELRNGIEIASLVCPLRYDVLMRRDFFPFYAAHRDLYQSNRGGFMALTKQTTYYTWYMGSEAVRTNGHLRGDRAALEKGFEERVCRAAELYESFQKGGFDLRFPLTLKTAERILPPTTDRGGPATGKSVSARYFLADGCHRLALLMAMGYKVLPQEYFRIKCYREFSPFDSTSLMVRRLAVQPSAYFEYLSSYYTAPHVSTNRDDFLGYVREHKPDLMDEVMTIMRVDGFLDERMSNG